MLKEAMVVKRWAGEPPTDLSMAGILVNEPNLGLGFGPSPREGRICFDGLSTSLSTHRLTTEISVSKSPAQVGLGDLHWAVWCSHLEPTQL